MYFSRIKTGVKTITFAGRSYKLGYKVGYKPPLKELLPLSNNDFLIKRFVKIQTTKIILTRITGIRINLKKPKNIIFLLFISLISRK